MRSLLILIFCCVVFSVWGNVKLNISSDTPILQTSRIEVHGVQPQPGGNFETKAIQEMEGILTVLGETTETLPYHFNFELKNLFLHLNMNDEEITYDIREPNQNQLIGQFLEIKNMKIPITIDDKGEIVFQNQILSELPILKEIYTKLFFQELFQHQFALIDQEIEIGKKIKKKVNNPTGQPIPETLTYTIENITDEFVEGSIRGTIEPKNNVLKSKHQVKEKPVENVEITLLGTYHGKIQWNRKHALNVNMDAKANYTAILKIGELEWIMTFNIDHELKSRKV